MHYWDCKCLSFHPAGNVQLLHLWKSMGVSTVRRKRMGKCAKHIDILYGEMIFMEYKNIDYDKKVFEKNERLVRPLCCLQWQDAEMQRRDYRRRRDEQFYDCRWGRTDYDQVSEHVADIQVRSRICRRLSLRWSHPGIKIDLRVKVRA